MATDISFKELIDTIVKDYSQEIAFSLIDGWKLAGEVYQTNCPFHDDRTPSFTFYYKDARPHFHCFGCGFHGDIINVVAELKGISNGEAINWIRENYLSENVTRAVTVANESVEFINKEVETTARLAEATKHLAERVIKKRQDGIDCKIASEFVTGYIDKNSEHKLAGRVLFPLKNPSGTIIGFTAWSPDKKPKYLHFPKSIKVSETLFNLDKAQDIATEKGFIVVVEGVFDVIKLTQCGVANVVAILGSSLSDRQAELLTQLDVPILFCFDGDEAGRKALEKVYNKLRRHGNIGYYYVELPNGEDPASYFNPGMKFTLDNFGGLEVKSKVILENVEDEDAVEHLNLNEKELRKYKKLAKKVAKSRKTRARKFMELVEKYIGDKWRVYEYRHRYYIVFLEENKNIAYDLNSKKVFRFIYMLAAELFDRVTYSDINLFKTVFESFAEKPSERKVYFTHRRRIFANGKFWYLRDQETAKCYMIDVEKGRLHKGDVTPPANVIFTYSPRRWKLPPITVPTTPENVNRGARVLYEVFKTETVVDTILLYSWALSGFIPFMERPILTITGKPGCGKTTTAKLLNMIIDADSDSFFPQDLKSETELLAILGNGSQVQIIDNLTSLNNKKADILASLTQGRDIRCRKLYTNDDSASVYIDPDISFIMTTYFDRFTTRDDILDRTLNVRLSPTGGIMHVDTYVWDNLQYILLHIFHCIRVMLKDEVIAKEVERYYKITSAGGIYEISDEAMEQIKSAFDEMLESISCDATSGYGSCVNRRRIYVINSNTISPTMRDGIRNENQMRFLFLLNSKIGEFSRRMGFFYYLTFVLCKAPVTLAHALFVADNMFDEKAEARIFDILMAKTDSSAQNEIISALYHFLEERHDKTFKGTYFELYHILSELYPVVRNIDYRTFVRHISRLNDSGNIFGIKLFRCNRKVVDGSKRQVIELKLIKQENTVVNEYEEFKKHLLGKVEVTEMARIDIQDPLSYLEEFVYDVENELIANGLSEPKGKETILEAAKIFSKKVEEKPEIISILQKMEICPAITMNSTTKWATELPDGSKGTNLLPQMLVRLWKTVRKAQ